MIRSRRDFLKLTGTMASGALASPTVARAHARRIAQAEFDAAIAQHAIWLSDRAHGTRAVFANCDLNGLNFTGERETLVDLWGADFTEADLTGVTGTLVSFRRASMHHARLSGSRLIEPTFIDTNLRGASCDNIVWGWDTGRQADSGIAEKPGAVMFNCDAGAADFAKARLRGHFLETNFTAAALTNADFSHSTFIGSNLQETSFFRADLTGARFDYAKIAYARFSKATLAGAEFSRAKFGPQVKMPARASVSIIVDQPEVLS